MRRSEQSGRESGYWARLRLRLARDLRDRRLRRAGPSDQRGMVLIMTMLMITVLTALASAAVVHTSSKLHEGSAYRLERAAYRIAEAGTMGAIALASQMPGGFETLASQAGGKLSMAHIGAGMLDLDPKSVDNSFGRELKALTGTGFSVEVSPPDIATAVAGYDASRFCFRSYRMRTTATIGVVDAKTPEEASSPSAEAALAAQLVVGPVPCAN